MSKNVDYCYHPENLTEVIGLDCERVRGVHGELLARVSIVNVFGEFVFDSLVQPHVKVIDYRTKITGLRRGDLANNIGINMARQIAMECMKDRVVVGHSIDHDLSVLRLNEDDWTIRDTAQYPEYANVEKRGKPSLKKLARLFLALDIQKGVHDSGEDAHTALKLYVRVAKEWESMIDSQSSECTDSESEYSSSSSDYDY